MTGTASHSSETLLSTSPMQLLARRTEAGRVGWGFGNDWCDRSAAYSQVSGLASWGEGEGNWPQLTGGGASCFVQSMKPPTLVIIVYEEVIRDRIKPLIYSGLPTNIFGQNNIKHLSVISINFMTL